MCSFRVSKFSCIKFVQRNKNVIQVFSGQYHNLALPVWNMFQFQDENHWKIACKRLFEWNIFLMFSFQLNLEKSTKIVSAMTSHWWESSGLGSVRFMVAMQWSVGFLRQCLYAQGTLSIPTCFQCILGERWFRMCGFLACMRKEKGVDYPSNIIFHRLSVVVVVKGEGSFWQKWLAIVPWTFCFRSLCFFAANTIVLARARGKFVPFRIQQASSEGPAVWSTQMRRKDCFKSQQTAQWMAHCAFLFFALVLAKTNLPHPEQNTSWQASASISVKCVIKTMQVR